MCGYCSSCLNDDNLNENEDYSAFVIASNNKDYRVVLEAGNSKPVALSFEMLVQTNSSNNYDNLISVTKQWIPVLRYEPDFCPKCGRDLRQEKEYLNKGKINCRYVKDTECGPRCDFYAKPCTPRDCITFCEHYGCNDDDDDVCKQQLSLF